MQVGGVRVGLEGPHPRHIYFPPQCICSRMYGDLKWASVVVSNIYCRGIITFSVCFLVISCWCHRQLR